MKNTKDQRYLAMWDRLSALTERQLKTIYLAALRDEVCVDTFNYDEKSRKFCPIAIAFGAKDRLKTPTNEAAEAFISLFMRPVNILKGLPGEFYHGDAASRRRDLLEIVRAIIARKRNLTSPQACGICSR